MIQSQRSRGSRCPTSSRPSALYHKDQHKQSKHQHRQATMWRKQKTKMMVRTSIERGSFLPIASYDTTGFIPFAWRNFERNRTESLCREIHFYIKPSYDLLMTFLCLLMTFLWLSYDFLTVSYAFLRLLMPSDGISISSYDFLWPSDGISISSYGNCFLSTYSDEEIPWQDSFSWNPKLAGVPNFFAPVGRFDASCWTRACNSTEISTYTIFAK